MSDLEPRRSPKQRRGQARRDAILEAAAQVLEARGYAGATTKRIAAAAEASVGAVYDYFPNKEAVFVALLERYQQQLGAALLEAMMAAEGWEAQLDAGIDAFYRFYRDTPGYQTLWLGTQLVDVLREAGRAYAESSGGLVATVIAQQAPHLPPDAPPRIATMLVHLVSAATTAALNGPDEQRDATMAEVRWLARLYLRERLAPGVEVSQRA